MNYMNIAAEARTAAKRIGNLIHRTPVERSVWLSQLCGSDVYLKLENFQYTRSFKVRGALNKVMALDREEARCVVAASAGNHGAGVAYASKTQGGTCVVFVPEHVSTESSESISLLGAEVTRHGQDCLETERAARRFAEERGIVYISPYNDKDVIAGQGTIGVELVEQLAGFDAVFISLGGGGLISGVASYVKSVHPEVRVVACSPENSPVMHRSIEAGRIMELPVRDTLSNATAGGIEEDSITLELCCETVDERVLVSEAEIRDTMRSFIDRERMLIEGASAVAAAALQKVAARYTGQKVVVLICGANVSHAQLQQILA